METGRKRVGFEKLRHLPRLAQFGARSKVWPWVYPSYPSARGLGGGSTNP